MRSAIGSSNGQSPCDRLKTAGERVPQDLPVSVSQSGPLSGQFFREKRSSQLAERATLLNMTQVGLKFQLPGGRCVGPTVELEKVSASLFQTFGMPTCLVQSIWTKAFGQVPNGTLICKINFSAEEQADCKCTRCLLLVAGQ